MNNISMKKSISLIFFVSLCFSSWSQTTKELAYSTFEKFAVYSSSGTSGDQLYDVLRECYEANCTLLSQATPNSQEEIDIKNNLKRIWPYLYNAAVFYQKDNAEKSLYYAKAYVDIGMNESFSKMNLQKDEHYSMIVYYTASKSFNSKQYKESIKYFKEYLSTGDMNHRKVVYFYMSQACDNINDFSLSQRVLDMAIAEYPEDFELLARAINNCIDSGDNDKLNAYLSKALAIRPNDKTLLGIQGKSYENSGNYQKAAEFYEQLKVQQPNNLNVYRHLAVDYYNTAVLNYNNSLFPESSSNAFNLHEEAKKYFKTAIPFLKNVLEVDSYSIQFWEALAIAYNYTDDKAGFASINEKLVSLGAGKLSQSVVPEVISLEEKKKNAPAMDMQLADEVPTFPEYAKRYIAPTLEKWQTKDPYETINEYQHRVNPETREKMINQLRQEAIDSYVKRFSQEVRISDFHLKPYDAENEVFLAESKFGEVVIPVPRANNEARTFEMSWGGVKLSDVQYCVDGEKLALKSIVFRTPAGLTYKYDNANALNYTTAQVDMEFADINYSQLASSEQSSVRKVNKTTVNVSTSDVDSNIPMCTEINNKTFAVIIANEEYNMAPHVPMALNDGRILAKYCQKTLGLPESNIRLYENATYGMMLGALREIRQIAEAYRGDIKVLFYYSGHGVPNENTKDAFLLPVDSDGLSTEVCYPLSRLYRELGDLNAKYVFVMLDACFSGANKDGEMMSNSSRGVAVVAKANQPQGNMIAFSAASGNETAYPLESKGHGLFTYYLLKKLQESAGNATLGELNEYVTENVKREAIVVNHKPQTPVMTPSFSMEENWKNIMLNK